MGFIVRNYTVSKLVRAKWRRITGIFLKFEQNRVDYYQLKELVNQCNLDGELI
jgi:hypothetical protein